MEKGRNKVAKRQNAGFYYILPWLAGLLVFQLYPFVQSLYYSFTNFNGTGQAEFVGLANYIKIFTKDDIAIKSLLITIVYVLIAVPLKLIFALFIALMLNKSIKGISIFRTVYYIPSILGSSVAVAMLWRFLFVNEGVVNQILAIFGVSSINFLGDERYALLTISLLAVWQFGSSMILFLAALKQVPASLYEAIKMDGAGRIKTFLFITLPMITPVILFNVVMQVINAFQEFTSVSIITNGGPMNSTNLYGFMLYKQAFYHGRMGYASALSWVLFGVILVITVIILKSSSSWVFYNDGGND